MAALQLAHSLVQHPVIRSAVHRGFEARDQALKVQAAVLAALNLPSADELDNVASRIKSLSQRLESLEDAVDRVDQNLRRLAAAERQRTAAAESSE